MAGFTGSPRHALGKHRGLHALKSRLPPSAHTDNQVVNLNRTFLHRVPEAPAVAA